MATWLAGLRLFISFPMAVEPEQSVAVVPAVAEEQPVATADFVERAFEPERAVTPLDVDETGWPRLPRSASTPRASQPTEPREFVFVSGAAVEPPLVLPRLRLPHG